MKKTDPKCVSSESEQKPEERKIIKSFKIRLYPTREQENLMWRHIGACRFVWNYFLNLQEERYKSGEKKTMSGFDMMYLLPPMKKQEEFSWLRDIASNTLQRELNDLAKAYTDFFKKKAHHPKFKSRRTSKASFPTAYIIYFENNKVTIGKIGKVKYKTDFDLPQGKGFKFTNPRISNVCGKWMLSFGMECEPEQQTLKPISCGIDLGVKDLAIAASAGEKTVVPNINKDQTVKAIERKIRHVQRSISRKYEASKARTGKFEKTRNIEKEQEKLRTLYHRLDGIRQNHIHQATHTFVSALPERIVMEDLNVSGMMKNRHLSRAIASQGLAEFRRQITYKAEWNGIETVFADRFYPSSKTCSVCGNVKKNLKLSDRTYKCEVCGAVIDRDYNAALNLEKYKQ